MSWREPILRVMRVPPEPQPPPGSPPRLFRAAPNFFKLRLLRWGVGQFFAVAGLIGATVFITRLAQTDIPRSVIFLLQVGEALAWVALIVQIVFGWLLVRLEYELRWYMLSDRALRIREGIAKVSEKTIVLANIQNIAVRQGPLQRFLGIADVEVKTAGGGGKPTEMDASKAGGEPMHIAYFRGVDNASEIRDLLREGVRRQRDTGLGDPDEPSAPSPDDAHAAAMELLHEARRLRAAVTH